MPRRGGKRKKSRTHQPEIESAQGALTSSEESKIPKSLVIRRGKCESQVADLVQDVRKIMMPYTAQKFQEDASFRKMTLSKYCQHVCLPLGVSHILAFSQNEERLNFRVAKTPQGPTLTFRVHRFSLAKHVQRLQKRPININTITTNPPIVVTNNFGDATAPPQVKLMRITFQNMFPAINVAAVSLKDVRRVVLFHLIDEEEDAANGASADGDAESDSEQQPKTTKQRIEVRHYAIKATPVGINRKVRRLVQTKLPNLNKVQDIADYIAGTATASTNVDAASDSEPEDGNAVVQLAQNYAGRGNQRQQKSALKLVELGPRISLELIKVEQGVPGDRNSSNAVMYNAHVTKTPAEIKELQARKAKEAMQKQQRRLQQERNVERKQKERDEKRDTKKRRREEREQQAMQELRSGGAAEMDDSDADDGSDDENDDDGSDDDN